MKESDKKLLFQYLCSSLPYGLVMSWGNGWEEHKRFILEAITSKKYESYIENGKQLAINGVYIEWKLNHTYSISPEFIKPYLRSLSSMTEDERKELSDLINKEVNGNDDCVPFDDGFPFSLYDTTGIKCCLGGERFYFDEMSAVYEWLNTHHFDYCGLIEKGLAIKVSEDNNPYKKSKVKL